MMSQAQLWLLVHDRRGQPVETTVEYRAAGQRRFRRMSYDKGLQRYVAKGLAEGACSVRIQGREGMTDETRQIDLSPGENHSSVMLGERGLRALRTPQGNWYFETRSGVRLLHVQGPGARERATEVLRKRRLSFEPVDLERPPGVDPKLPTPDDDVLLQVETGEGEDAGLVRLRQVSENILPELGLRADTSVPAYVDDEVAFGITGEIIIRFESAATIPQIDALSQEYQLERLRPIAWMGNAFLFRHRGGASLDLLDVVESINENDIVVYAELNIANRLQSFTYTPTDYLYPETPHLPLINSDDAWDTIQTLTPVHRGGSPDLVVAVLDLHGVDPTHGELTGTLSDGTAKQIANFDFVNMANQTFTNLAGEHGTQCAGSATGLFDNTVGSCGIAPNCKLIGGRFSGFATDLQIADIWVWMAGFPTGSTSPTFPAQLPKGADVISNSWGPSIKPPNQTLRDAFDFLTTYPRAGRGVVMVFATGNYGYSLVDTRNPFSADAKTLGIGASINVNPTNPVNSLQPDHQGNTNNLPAVVDTRSYISPYGMTVDLVSSSHTCYGPGLPGAGIVDPIMAPARTGFGDWPAAAVSSTSLTSAVSVGDTMLPVASTTGFVVGAAVLVGIPGAPTRETTTVIAVGANQLTVNALTNAYPSGTSVVTGPADFAMNASVGFGGTSHSCPTVAGAAALLLSVQQDLNWVEVRQILRDTAVQIDPTQAFATGQWLDLDGDGVVEYSQWYGYGRLDVDAAVSAAISFTARTDAVVRDNLADTGAVPSVGWHALSPDIWARKTDDPIPALAYGSAPPHENPRSGQDNWVYVRVRNNGTGLAPVIYLRALITHFPGVEFEYPEDWEPTPRFGSTPTLPLEPGTYFLAYPVKGDNNIAHRNISIDYPATGGSAGLMTAVVAGTRTAAGVDSFVIDRTAVPPDVELLIGTPDTRVLKSWVEQAESGTGILPVDPLGVQRPTRLDYDQVEIGESGDVRCAITLLDPARVAVRCCDGNTLLIEAVRNTRIALLCHPGGRPILRGDVYVGEWQDRTVLRVKHGVGAIALPLRLAAGQWVPIFVGTDQPNATDTPQGRILISQIRGDGVVAPGYELSV